MIQPRTLKGFRDFLPETMLPREELLTRFTNVYRSYGFVPIDTPVLEYLEVLTGKGSDETDKQLYKFTDHGGREVGMRFDLTVPFARFAAQHIGTLGVPFKRYHMAKVWRGENTQAGRYREFVQCDFDTIGTTSLASDIETALVLNDALERIDLVTGATFTSFKIRINNRKVLTGLLEKLGLADRSVAVLRALDKLAKVGARGVADEMTQTANATPEQIDALLQLASLRSGGETNIDNDTILASATSLLSGNALGLEGIAALRDLLSATESAGVPRERIVIDVSIARGLDYYTSTIYETFLDAMPEIGSVASGGRYDNLAGMFTKQSLPGVGASIGLDRLLAAMEQLGMLPQSATAARVFIPFFVASRLGDYLRIAAELRRAGVAVELFPEPKKLGVQLKYADKKGFLWAIIIGDDEFASQTAQVKDLVSGETVAVPFLELSIYMGKK
ncbi:MAG: histidine--tRNA ligase [Thermoguttaceae bacterium]